MTLSPPGPLQAVDGALQHLVRQLRHLPPPIFAALYWWQQRRALPVGAGITTPLPEWLRTWCAAGNGLALVVVFTLILIAPGLLVGAGPWTFTPLMARALSGWGICLGLLLLSMAENVAPRPPGDADAYHPGPGASSCSGPASGPRCAGATPGRSPSWRTSCWSEGPAWPCGSTGSSSSPPPPWPTDEGGSGGPVRRACQARRGARHSRRPARSRGPGHDAPLGLQLMAQGVAEAAAPLQHLQDGQVAYRPRAQAPDPGGRGQRASTLGRGRPLPGG